jgi:hypothetical protein
MNFSQIYHRLVDIGEAADTLCRQYPDIRVAMHLRDIAYQIEHSMKALSSATLEAISRS